MNIKIIHKYKHYRLVDNYNKPIILNTCTLKIPFGVENYNGKNIINFELDPQRDNDSYNMFAILQNIEKQIMETNIIKKPLYPILKNNGKKYLLRVHLKKEMSFSIVDNNNTTRFLTNSELKDRYCTGIISFGSIWTNNENFGVLIYLDDVQLKN